MVVMVVMVQLHMAIYIMVEPDKEPLPESLEKVLATSMPEVVEVLIRMVQLLRQVEPVEEVLEMVLLVERAMAPPIPEVAVVDKVMVVLKETLEPVAQVY